MTGKNWKSLLKSLLIGCIVGVTLLTGCGMSQSETMDQEDMKAYFDALESYEAKVQVTFFSNKNENTYLVAHQVQKDGKYRMEIKEPSQFLGATTISDGNTVIQTDPSIGGSVKAKDTPVRDALFLYEFAENFAKGQGSYAVDADGLATVKVPYESTMEKISSACLMFNTATRQPERLEIYDSKGEVSIRMIFESFEPNKVFDASLFNVAEESAAEESQPARE